ncbi:MAG: GTPase [Oscillatoriales cyanobacterium]|nr:MAG: GTPase [Oscillatoriales cyanobacterium]
MIRLARWQWAVLGLPLVAIVGLILWAAGAQLHAWGLSWIWGLFTAVLVGWRWLLVRWTKPVLGQVEAAIAAAGLADWDAAGDRAAIPVNEGALARAETSLQGILQASQSDPAPWEDWNQFWQRCLELTTAVAKAYYPESTYPLLSIYVPQAYRLIRGTVDDLDRWMQQLEPVLGQVTVGQAYETYTIYQKLEPSMRKVWQAWQGAQWLLNPVVAMARMVTRRSRGRAGQELLANLAQVMREAALRNLAQQAIALYGGNGLPPASFAPSSLAAPQAQTQTLQDLIAQAEPEAAVVAKPINVLLLGRTGAGKSSLVNALFAAELAETDVLPNTDRVASYEWRSATGDRLTLWDAPGYEQVGNLAAGDRARSAAQAADLILLVTPALDPALQMDLDCLQALQRVGVTAPVIGVVSQVDRLRPIREWQPPYDWIWGDRPKEQVIREAVSYRSGVLGSLCDRWVPVVLGDRGPWGIEALSLTLLEAISPAEQLRLARFLRDRDARAAAAIRIVDQYRLQMSTTRGLMNFLKSPVLQLISRVMTGSPTLAYLLAERIPIERLPVAIGKLQLAWDLFGLLQPAPSLEGERSPQRAIDWLALWPLVVDCPGSPESEAWALGQALVEHWTQNTPAHTLHDRVTFYRQSQQP